MMENEEYEKLPTHEELMELINKMGAELTKAFKETGLTLAGMKEVRIDDLISNGIIQIKGADDSCPKPIQKPLLLKPNRSEIINDNDIKNLIIELNREQGFNSFLERV
jgi:hypothetical protein